MANKKSVTVTLYMSELIYDIQNKTYLTGRSRDTGSNFEEVAHMQASDDEENGNQIYRSICNAYAKINSELSEYLGEDSKSGVNNELVGEDEDIMTFAFSLPTNFNRAAQDNLSASLHQYIVNSAIADWFMITNKTDAADYVQLASNALVDARRTLSKRVRPTRKDVTLTLTGKTIDLSVTDTSSSSETE